MPRRLPGGRLTLVLVLALRGCIRLPCQAGLSVPQYGAMPRWTCPRCDREFGRPRQAHTCVPGCTVDATFAGRPAALRSVYDEIREHLRTLGPVHEDAAVVGVFLKRDRKLAEVRPRSRDVSLALYLPRPVDDPRFSRVLGRSGPRVIHVLLLRGADEVDGQVRDWLTQAFLHASG